MSDGTTKHDDYMSKNQGKENKNEEEVEETEETTEEEEETEEESDSDESEDSEDEDEESEEGDSDKSKHSDKEDEDLDNEIEKEKKLGKPDPEKARKAFKERKEERESEEDDDKPLTQKDIDRVRQDIRQEMADEQAAGLIAGMTKNPKEAELVLLKWKNRQWPDGLSIPDQIEEAFLITHKKKIFGENKELKRALVSKGNVNKDPSGTHQDPKTGKEPKLREPDARAIKDAGFVFNKISRRFEKKLSNGGIVVRGKNGETTYIPQSK